MQSDVINWINLSIKLLHILKWRTVKKSPFLFRMRNLSQWGDKLSLGTCLFVLMLFQVPPDSLL